MIKKDFHRIGFVITLAVMSLALFGCQTAYYGTMEKFGVHKRDILVDRVKEARDVQEETKEQFQTALERFKSETGFKGGELEARYDALKSEFDQCEEKATAVKNKISAVENVAKALFAEWSEELDQYTNPKFKAASHTKLERTKKQYSLLISAMKRAESKIKPVLSAFRDQVLYLKHNLNARAIASLRSELVSVETDVAALIKDMEAAINKADGFIQAMKAE
jgi:predicted  nucleic acid-binding Zn-ribbon protein